MTFAGMFGILSVYVTGRQSIRFRVASIEGGRATSSDARKTARERGQNRAKNGHFDRFGESFCEHRAGFGGCTDARR